MRKKGIHDRNTTTLQKKNQGTYRQIYNVRINRGRRKRNSLKVRKLKEKTKTHFIKIEVLKSTTCNNY
jgi:hypothetical protein